MAYVEGLRAVMLIRHSVDVVVILSLSASIKNSSRRALIRGLEPSKCMSVTSSEGVVQLTSKQWEEFRVDPDKGASQIIHIVLDLNIPL